MRLNFFRIKKTPMNDQEFQAAIVAALQSLVNQEKRAVNFDFAPTVPAEVTGTVSPQ